MDLSGKLVIKAGLGDDVRRIPIHNEEITLDELLLMMQRVFRGKLSTTDDVTIKYKDEDGDLITIFDSSDLNFAIQCCGHILKITLFVNQSATSAAAGGISVAEAAAFRRELRGVRDQVNSLLDRLGEAALPPAAAAVAAPPPVQAVVGQVTRESTSTPVSVVGGKEFDPLTSALTPGVTPAPAAGGGDDAQAKVMASFGADQNVSSSSASFDRAATPDSVSSVGSSASRPPQHQAYNPAAMQPGMPPQQQPPQQQPQQPPQQQPSQAAQAPAQPPAAQGYPVGGQSAYGSPQPPQGAAQQPQQYDPAMYGQQQPGQPQPPPAAAAPAGYPPQPGYPAAPGQAPPNPHMMYAGHPQGPPQGPPQPQYQAPGVPQPQGPQAKAPGYPPAPSPGANPYSRGGPGGYGGYPRPTAGYPQ